MKKNTVKRLKGVVKSKSFYDIWYYMEIFEGVYPRYCKNNCNRYKITF